MHPRITRILGLSIPVAFLLVWVLLLWTIGPTTIIQRLGVQNGYLLAFVISAIGGFSVLTSAPLIASISALAYAGLDPFLLGAISGLGMTIGDSLYFWIGIAGKAVIEDGEAQKRIRKIELWLSDKPKWMVPFVVYVYVGLTPLPNEALLLSISLAGGKFRSVLPSLLLGNITLAIAIALVGSQLLEEWGILKALEGMLTG